MVEKVETEEVEESQQEVQQEEEPTETVPKERLDAVTAELTSQKEANELLQQNMALMRANAPAQPKKEEFDIYAHVGLNPEDPDDVANQKQLKEIDKYRQGIRDFQIAQIRFLIDHPDYPEIVGTAEQIQAGQFAKPLQEAINSNPSLIAMIQTSANPQSAAYQIAKLHQQNKAEGKTTTKKDAKEVIDEAIANANRVKSSANTKGGEALSEEGRYANMSDPDFLKLAASRGAVM